MADSSAPEARRARWSAIAHAGLALIDPVSRAAVDAALDRLDLPPGARVLDVGCGKGEVLLRLVERRPDVRGVGIDLDESFLAEARAAAERRVPGGDVTFRQVDGRTLSDPAGSLDALIVVGASHALGGLEATLATAAHLLRPTGGLLLGEGYWRREPAADYLAALGATSDELSPLEGLLDVVRAAGFGVRHRAESSPEDWDRYERAWAENGLRWAADHPDDPDHDDLVRFIRAGRRRYEELGGRETLAFVLLVLEAPAA